MKLQYPYKNPFISQGFAQNLNSYYAEGGLKGHSGVDMFSGYGSIINCAIDSYCYSVRLSNDPMRYSAIYTIVDDEDTGLSYEVSYGHISGALVQQGTYLKAGQPIALEGNFGDVAVGGKAVTLAQKKAQPGIGSHLHFQVRLIKKVTEEEAKKNTDANSPVLVNQDGRVKKDGFCYQIVNYNNGENGCIDPMQFFPKKTIVDTIKQIITPQITQTLRYGMKGSQVKILQKKLGVPADGIFGHGTEKAVKDFQTKNGLIPDGVVGVKTVQKLG